MERYLLRQDRSAFVNAVFVVVRNRGYYKDYKGDCDKDDVDVANADKCKGKGNGRGRKGRGKQRGRNNIHDAQADTTDAFNQNYGKWAHRAITELNNPAFWVALAVSNHMQDRLDPFQWIIQKYQGDRNEGSLARLVYGRASEVYNNLC